MTKTRSAARDYAARLECLEQRRLLSAGDPDLAFSNDGRMSFNFPGAPFTVTDSAVTTEGKTIVGGTRGTNIALARVNLNGTLDTTFGNGGLFESSRRTELTSLAVQGDGKIVVGLGRSSGYEHLDLNVGRILANGSGFDPDFGTNGIAHSGEDTFAASLISDVAVQRDGRIIGAGAAENGILLDYEFAVVRYTADGVLDTIFGDDGISLHSFGDDTEGITAVTIDYNGDITSNPLYGTIVAVGGIGGNNFPSTNNAPRFQILRLRSDGDGDNGFDGDGKLTSPNLSGAGIEYASDVAVQPGGKIVVGGTAKSSTDPNLANFLVARFTNTGVLDTSFGLGGQGVTELDLGGRDTVGAIAIGYHNLLGNLIVSGSRDNQMSLVALTPDGQLDARFSGDGILNTTIPGDATGLFATGTLFPTNRRLVFVGGNGQVGRYIDVGSLISVGTFQPQMYEQGSVATSFLVTRTQALPFAETIILTTSGTATPLGSSRDFNATGILFGNGQTTSTEVVIPANATTATVVLTPIDDALVEGDETIGFAVATSLAYDASATNSTTLVVRDNDTVGGPEVIDSGFNYETAPLNATITFNQSVVTTFTIGDLVITGPSPTPPAYSLDYNNVTNTGKVVFYNGLADGNYTVRVKASGVRSLSGTPMANDYVFGFFVLAGDANRSRTVDIADLAILATNWQQSPRTFSQGDFNYDGTVDISDLAILATNWQVGLPVQGLMRERIGSPMRSDTGRLVEVIFG